MNAVELLRVLVNLDVRLWVSNGRLQVDAPRGALTDALRAALLEHKPDLLRLLAGERSQADEARAPATPMQEAYLVGRQPVPLGSIGCHVYFEFDVSAFDAERLKTAFREVALRHEALQASFSSDGHVQLNEPAREPPFADIDLTHATPTNIEAQLQALRARHAHQVFDPSVWPLFEVVLVRMPQGQQRLAFSLDMLIADAASTLALFAEWQVAYERAYAQRNPASVGFRRAALDALLRRAQADRGAARAYFHERLANVAAGPSLPLRVPLESVLAPRFERASIRLPPAAWLAFKAHCRGVGVTPTTGVAALLADALRVWSDAPGEFVLNFTTQERPAVLAPDSTLLGNFTSNMLVPVPERGASFADNCRALQRELLLAMQHAQLSGLEVARELRRSQADRAWGFASAPIVFTSLLGSHAHDLAAWPGEPGYAISQTPQVAMDFQLSEGVNGLCCNCDFVAELFPDALPRELLSAVEDAITRLARDETAWVERRPISLPPTQRARRNAVNATHATLPVTRLERAFIVQARARPEAIALITPEVTLSYRQLLAAAGELAQRLLADGVRPGDCVAVCAPKGFEQVVAVLGVLLAGAAYVPVDPELPEARRTELLRKARCRHVVTPPLAAWLGKQRIVTVSRELFESRAEPPIVPGACDDTQALAYVIFTSGSTGTPKGVMVSHAAAANTIADINARWQVGPTDRVLGLSALSFDLSVYDIFGALAAGAALVLPPSAAERDPHAWLHLCDTHAVTIWNSVPRLFEMFVERVAERDLPATLRLALLSGDFLPVNLARTVSERWPALQLVSLGGATEAAIWSIAHPITRVAPEWSSIPYGMPLANQSFAVVDPELEDCPDWVSGELLIAGSGIARGYCDDAALSAQAFITRPSSNQRVYRTGDFGRYLPNGEIEILGRRDGQVKLGGYRIELGDVEAALERHPGVRAAAALVTALALANDAGHRARSLRALVVAEAGYTLEPAELEAFTRTQLPAYMLPQRIRCIASLPLSPNGKLDRAQLSVLLAELDRQAEAVTAQAPAIGQASTALERVILSVWSRVLGLTSIHADANFFDIGGDSLLMLRAHRLLVAELGRDVALVELYRRPKPRLLAAILSQDDEPEPARNALAIASAQRAKRRQRALAPRTR